MRPQTTPEKKSIFAKKVLASPAGKSNFFSVKTKKQFSLKKLLVAAAAAVAFSAPASHASGSLLALNSDFGTFDSAIDGQWFATFANFQTPYSGYFSLASLTAPVSEMLLSYASPVIGPVQAVSDPVTSASSVQFNALPAATVQTTAPIANTTLAAEPVLRTISVPAESAALGGGPVPRTIVITPPTPHKKPVYSGL